MPCHFRYVGSKSWLCGELLELFGALPCSTLVSPFWGTGVFEYAFARAHPEKAVLGFDSNAALVNFHRAYAEDPIGLEEALGRLEPSLTREEFLVERDALEAAVLPDPPDPDLAALFVRFMCHCFSGKWASYGGTHAFPSKARHLTCPPNFTASLGDALEVLREWLPREEGCFYIDPPYLVPRRHYQQGRNDSFPHEELAALLRAWGGARWVVSYNECQAVRQLYQGFRIEQAQRPRSERLDGTRGRAVELLIFSDGL
jgi:DNA adenine methylase